MNQTSNRTLLPLALGLCPAVCGATSIWNGLAVGIAVVLVFAASEWIVSLLEKSLPDTARFPVLLAAAAGLTALLMLLTEAFLPGIYAALSGYLPLSAVSCLLLDRVPSLKSTAAAPVFGCFVLALAGAGAVCEFLGAGTLFGAAVLPETIEGAAVLSKAPGAFLMLAFILMGVKAYSLTDGEEAAK